jgi:uncharacterized protein (TIGR00730 family)
MTPSTLTPSQTTSRSKRPFSICVYCGSRPGRNAEYKNQAQALGEAIAARGWRLVYGGGHVGLMGTVADAVLSAGGKVLGVIPTRLIEREVEHKHLTELVIVETMHERKKRMAEEADIFIALPGGIGTLEEFFEVWTWRHLGYHDQPIGLLNVEGFYDPMLHFLQQAQDEGFMDANQTSMVKTESDAIRLLDLLAVQTVTSLPDDYRLI